MGLPVSVLAGVANAKVDSLLKRFTEKMNGIYQCFVINADQGRGLDFPTNAEIEAHGGNYLIVGVLPKDYLQYDQFLGRVGRMNHKGRYSVVIEDKNAVNLTCEAHLNTVLDIL